MPTVFETLIAVRDAAEINQVAFGRVEQQLGEQRIALSAMLAGSARNSMLDRLERSQAKIRQARAEFVGLRDGAAREAAALNGNLPPLPVPSTNGPISFSPFVHIQAQAAVQWTVNHNRGYRPAAVTVLSVGGVEIEAAITHVTDNQLVVDFAVPSAGSVLVL